MKPLRMRLQEARKRLGLPWDVLERDYLLSWVLAGRRLPFLGRSGLHRDRCSPKGGDDGLGDRAGMRSGRHPP